MSTLTKTLSATLASLTLAAALAAAPAPAEARNGVNAALAAGAVGGLALGAMIASQPRAYAAPVYGGPVYVSEPDCYVVKRRVWTDFGWRTVRQTVCD
jgi:hypothetical protein